MKPFPPRLSKGPCLKTVHPSVREVAVLQEATEMILSSMDLDTVLHQILLIVRNYFGTANSSVFLVDPTTQELYCRAHNGYPEELARSLRIKVGKGVTGWVAQSKAPLYVSDVSRESRYIAAVESVKSELALPLLVRDEVIGVLNIGSDKLDYFNEDMIGLLALFAGQAAVALENARLYSTERRRMRQIELINLIARSATGAQDVEQLLSNLADLINDTFDTVDVCILLRDKEGQLALRAHAGPQQQPPQSFTAAEHAGIIAQAFAARNNVVANDLAGHPEWPACIPGSGSELCVPLVSMGETLGALVVAHSAPQFFSAYDRSIAQAAADVCATAIRNVQLADELRRVTNIDPLTGLYNQRYFHVLAAQETARCRRYHKHFSMLMIELRNFRFVNGPVDRGDEVLKRVAQALRHQVRGVDSICRYGSDRFVMVLPETNRDNVETIAAKLQTCLRSVGLTAQPDSARLSTKFAPATYPEDGNSELELVRALLARIADERGTATSAGA